MLVVYLSDGEQNAVMKFEDLEANYRESLDGAPSCELNGAFNIDSLIGDIAEALDGTGFWHGLIHVYNVCVIRLDVIAKVLDERKEQIQREANA